MRNFIQIVMFDKTKQKESGNILFIILIAVALFAALSYAVTSTTRGGNSNVDNEKSALQASELEQYVTALHGAIQRMTILKGCLDTEISFERSPFDGTDSDYVNVNSPADFSCHIFHVNGGGVSPREFDFAETVVFSGRNYVPGHGVSDNASSDSNELMILMRNVSLSVCRALNKANSIGSDPYDPLDISFGNASSTKFIGSFGGAASYFNSPLVIEPYSACIDPNTVNGIDRNGENWFYSIIHVR